MKSFNTLKKILLFFIVINSLTILINIHESYALNNNEEYLDIDIKFDMFEASVQEGFSQDVSSLNIGLPSPTWNIKDVEINFTNIEFNIETRIIEKNPIKNVAIDKHNDGYGVQIEISEPALLYGVQIYGKNVSSENKPIYVYISGFDELKNAPNNTLYGVPVLLNMPYSETATWHTQSFTSLIPLQPGNYYLVIDGSAIGTSPNSDYYWYFNDIDPVYPELCGPD